MSQSSNHPVQSSKVHAFRTAIFKHPRQEDVKSQVRFSLDECPSTSLVNLVGPSGVGKSTLKDRLVQDVLSEHHEQMQLDRDFVPVLSTTASADGHRQFSWKEFYLDALRGLGDPFWDARPREIDKSDFRFKGAGECVTGSNLRRRLEFELRRRRVLYWIVDEANHAFAGAKSGGPGDQYDVLKSLAQRSEVKLVLIGTLILKDLVHSSAQLARRSTTIQYGRYQCTSDDLKVFGSVVQSMLVHMRLGGHPDVATHLEYFYKSSLGCVGLLKDWLTSALALAIQQGATALTMKHLDAAAYPADVLKTIEDELTFGESGSQLGTAYRSDSPVKKRKASSANRKPGERLPGRDPVGKGRQLGVAE